MAVVAWRQALQLTGPYEFDLMTCSRVPVLVFASAGHPPCQCRMLADGALEGAAAGVRTPSG